MKLAKFALDQPSLEHFIRGKSSLLKSRNQWDIIIL